MLSLRCQFPYILSKRLEGVFICIKEDNSIVHPYTKAGGWIPQRLGVMEPPHPPPQ